MVRRKKDLQEMLTSDSSDSEEEFKEPTVVASSSKGAKRNKVKKKVLSSSEDGDSEGSVDRRKSSSSSNNNKKLVNLSSHEDIWSSSSAEARKKGNSGKKKGNAGSSKKKKTTTKAGSSSEEDEEKPTRKRPRTAKAKQETSGLGFLMTDFVQDDEERKLLSAFRTLPNCHKSAEKTKLVNFISDSLDNAALCQRLLYRNVVKQGHTFWSVGTEKLLEATESLLKKSKFSMQQACLYVSVLRKLVDRAKGIRGIVRHETMLKLYNFCYACWDSQQLGLSPIGVECIQLLGICLQEGNNGKSVSIPWSNINELWALARKRGNQTYIKKEHLDEPHQANLLESLNIAFRGINYEISMEMMGEFFRKMNQWIDIAQNPRENTRELLKFDLELLNICNGIAHTHGANAAPGFLTCKENLVEFLLFVGEKYPIMSQLKQAAALCVRNLLRVVGDWNIMFGMSKQIPDLKVGDFFRVFFGTSGSKLDEIGNAFGYELNFAVRNVNQEKNGYYTYLSLASDLLHFLPRSHYEKLLLHGVEGRIPVVQLLFVLFREHPLDGPHMTDGLEESSFNGIMLIQTMETLFNRLEGVFKSIAPDNTRRANTKGEAVWILRTFFPLVYSCHHLVSKQRQSNRFISALCARLWYFLMRKFVPFVVERFGATSTLVRLGLRLGIALLNTTNVVDPLDIQSSFPVVWNAGIYSQPAGEIFQALFASSGSVPTPTPSTSTIVSQEQQQKEGETWDADMGDHPHNMGFRNPKDAAQYALPHVAMLFIVYLVRYANLHESNFTINNEMDSSTNNSNSSSMTLSQQSASSSDGLTSNLSPFLARQRGVKKRKASATHLARTLFSVKRENGGNDSEHEETDMEDSAASRRETLLRWVLKWVYYASISGQVKMDSLKAIALILVTLIRPGEVADDLFSICSVKEDICEIFMISSQGTCQWHSHGTQRNFGDDNLGGERQQSKMTSNNVNLIPSAVVTSLSGFVHQKLRHIFQRSKMGTNPIGLFQFAFVSGIVSKAVKDVKNVALRNLGKELFTIVKEVMEHEFPKLHQASSQEKRLLLERFAENPILCDPATIIDNENKDICSKPEASDTQMWFAKHLNRFATLETPLYMFGEEPNPPETRGKASPAKQSVSSKMSDSGESSHSSSSDDCFAEDFNAGRMKKTAKLSAHHSFSSAKSDSLMMLTLADGNNRSSSAIYDAIWPTPDDSQSQEAMYAQIYHGLMALCSVNEIPAVQMLLCGFIEQAYEANHAQAAMIGLKIYSKFAQTMVRLFDLKKPPQDAKIGLAFVSKFLETAWQGVNNFQCIPYHLEMLTTMLRQMYNLVASSTRSSTNYLIENLPPVMIKMLLSCKTFVRVEKQANGGDKYEMRVVVKGRLFPLPIRRDALHVVIQSCKLAMGCGLRLNHSHLFQILCDAMRSKSAVIRNIAAHHSVPLIPPQLLDDANDEVSVMTRVVFSINQSSLTLGGLSLTYFGSSLSSASNESAAANAHEMNDLERFETDSLNRSNWIYLANFGMQERKYLRDILFMICVSGRRRGYEYEDDGNQGGEGRDKLLKDCLQLRSSLFQMIIRKIASHFHYESVQHLFDANSEFLLLKWLDFCPTKPIEAFLGEYYGTTSSIAARLQKNQSVRSPWFQFPYEYFQYENIIRFSKTAVPIVLPAVLLIMDETRKDDMILAMLTALEPSILKRGESVLRDKQNSFIKTHRTDIMARCTLQQYLSSQRSSIWWNGFGILKEKDTSKVLGNEAGQLELICRVVEMITIDGGGFGVWEGLSSKIVFEEWLPRTMKSTLSILTQVNSVEIILHMIFRCEIYARIDPTFSIKSIGDFLKYLQQSRALKEPVILSVVIHSMLRLLKRHHGQPSFGELVEILRFIPNHCGNNGHLGTFIHVVTDTACELLTGSCKHDRSKEGQLEKLLQDWLAELSPKPEFRGYIRDALDLLGDRIPKEVAKRAWRTVSLDEYEKERDAIDWVIEEYGDGLTGEGLSSLRNNPDLYGPICVSILQKLDAFLEDASSLDARHDAHPERLSHLVWILLEIQTSFPNVNDTTSICHDVRVLSSNCLGKLGILGQNSGDLFSCYVEKVHRHERQKTQDVLFTYLANVLSSKDIGLAICASETIKCMFAMDQVKAKTNFEDYDWTDEWTRDLLAPYHRASTPHHTFNANRKGAVALGKVRNNYVQVRLQRKEEIIMQILLPSVTQEQRKRKGGWKPEATPLVFQEAWRAKTVSGNEDDWICAMSYGLAMFGVLREENSLYYTGNMCALDPTFARLAFPILITSIVQNDNELEIEDSMVTKLALEFNHVLQSEDTPTYIARVLLESLEHVRRVHLMEVGECADQGLLKEKKKHSHDTSLEIMDPLLQRLDKLTVAKACLRCEMATMAILHIELWYHETGPLGREERVYKPLLLEAYKKLGARENFCGVGFGTTLFDSVEAARLAHDWEGSLVGLDGLLQSQQHQNQMPLQTTNLFKQYVAESLLKMGLYTTFMDYSLNHHQLEQKTPLQPAAMSSSSTASAYDNSNYMSGAEEVEDRLYEIGWRFLKGVDNEKALFQAATEKSETYLRRGKSYHFVLYQLLSSIVDGDESRFQSMFNIGRDQIQGIIAACMSSKEQVGRTVDVLHKLQLLHELRRVWQARWQNEASNIVPAIDHMMKNWNKEVNDIDSIDFDDSEMVLSLRTSVLRSVMLSFSGMKRMTESMEKSLVKHLLFVTSFAREHGKPKIARNMLHTCLTSLSNSLLQLTDGEISSELQLEKATVFWANGDGQYAIAEIKDLVRGKNMQEMSLLRAKALLRGGSWLVENHSESFEVIKREYLDQAIGLCEKIQDNYLLGKCHHTMAKYVDRLFQGLHSEISSPMWRRMDHLLEGQRETLEMMRRLCAHIKATMSSSSSVPGNDPSLQTPQEKEFMERFARLKGTAKEEEGKRIRAQKRKLEKQTEAEESKRAQQLTAYQDMLESTIEHYCKALTVCPTDSVVPIGGVFRLMSLWFEHESNEQVNELIRGFLVAKGKGKAKAKEGGKHQLVPSAVFVPVVYQIVSRLGDGATRFSQVLSEVLVRLGMEHPFHTLPHLFALINNNYVLGVGVDTMGGPGSSSQNFHDEGSLGGRGAASSRRKSLGTDGSTTTSKYGLFGTGCGGFTGSDRSRSPQQIKAHAATEVVEKIRTSSQKMGDIVKAERLVLEAFIELAFHDAGASKSVAKKQSGRLTTDEKVVPKHFKDKMVSYLALNTRVPIPTSDVPTRFDTNYSNTDSKNASEIDYLDDYKKKFSYVGTGVSCPKKYDVQSSRSGRWVRMVVKSNDELRQDAVIEKFLVFVKDLLHKDPQTANMKAFNLRTYNVVPLNRNSGIIEMVDAVTLGSYLYVSGDRCAHNRYRRPNDMKYEDCFHRMKNTEKQPPQVKHNVFLSICERFPPVFHHFFLEHYKSPIEWYTRRNSYSRSVGVNSMIGYILGIGDRHSQNILIDKATAEVIHIDFGIVFEAGKLLPIPETVPFRLTRDIVDGLGIMGTNGVFLSTCQDSLRVLRKNMDNLLAILKVFVYDPLQEWSVTKVKAAQVEDDGNEDLGGGNDALFDESNTTITNNNNGTSGTNPTMKTRFSNGDSNEGNWHAENVLLRIQQKLQGREDPNGDILGVEGQVARLINEATDTYNLAQIYRGWAPFC